MSMVQNLISNKWQPGKAAVDGLAATVAYSVAMEGDMILAKNAFSDVRFIEGMIAGTKSTPVTRTLAWVLHMLNGVALAEVYAATFKRWLPGPDWLKGSLFAELFVVGVWGLTPLADKYHPLIKDGQLPKLFTWKSFFQNLIRHFVFGLVLGLLYRGKK
ncbi:MAG TPA: hypothetical protein DHW02_02815 [Ktedonobacter sp.]|nr:hypothetical protein [Ktedonobacter sp.]